jgi:hypothetical protein
MRNRQGQRQEAEDRSGRRQEELDKLRKRVATRAEQIADEVAVEEVDWDRVGAWAEELASILARRSRT